ncbi:ABC transporter periplasmic-binding protein ytfQ precursor [Serratia fonticola]|uniref:ABC transporter periplasmic-binding protein ytfQ n=1 Tax=Serratia fonticola TaxID=47917 RepID=A0A4U9WQB2_SERFO|nr:ABC transporter periplasmic-binding protein ytfQ precursor [Serratia fonticola]
MLRVLTPIFIAPVVATGWTPVLQEAKEAKIPVFLLDRMIEVNDPSLYTAAVASDSVHEGKVAGEWLVKAVAASPVTWWNCKAPSGPA